MGKLAGEGLGDHKGSCGSRGILGASLTSLTSLTSLISLTSVFRVSVLLPANAERVGVSRMRDFSSYLYIIGLIKLVTLLIFRHYLKKQKGTRKHFLVLTYNR